MLKFFCKFFFFFIKTKTRLRELVFVLERDLRYMYESKKYKFF